MLANQVKNAGILRSMISLNNLIQEEIKVVLSEFPINYLEYSILTYVSQNILTQYKIAKEYNMSVQRINQIISSLEKIEFVEKKEIKINGRIAKEIIITTKGEKKIKKINDKVIKMLEMKDIDANLLSSFDKSLKVFLENLSSENSIKNSKK